jgi:hypothetical protein
MYASGSTWVFNASRKIAAALFPGLPLVAPFITLNAELPDLEKRGSLTIVKSHETDDAAALALSRHAHAIWLSVRDPRDCVTSLMLYQEYDFDLALATVAHTARFCARFAVHPRAELLRYEDGFIDDPATLDRFAAGFGATLAAPDRARIFAETRRVSIEALIERLEDSPTAVEPEPGHFVDLASQWHNHHAHRTGEIGRWRHMLTAGQVTTVEQRLADWMARFGYRPAAAGPNT